MREPRHATWRRVRGELGRPPPAFDGAPDDRVALAVCREHSLVPVGTGDRLAQMRNGRSPSFGDVDVEVERRLAELAEPEAALVDEIDRESVAARGGERP